MTQNERDADKTKVDENPRASKNDWFRHSAPYINAHRGKTFVLCLPGEALEHDNFPGIVQDITLLASLGVRLVLVHGVRPQLNRVLDSSQNSSDFHAHNRVTDPQALEALKSINGSVRSNIEALFSMGLPNSPMHGAHLRLFSGNFVIAKPVGVIDGVDMQWTGSVRRVDGNAIRAVLDNKGLALLSPLGYSITGEAFNVSAYEVAVAAAVTLQADKLLVFTEEASLCDDEGERLGEMTLLQAAAAMKNMQPESNHYQALNACYQACEQGVTRAQMLGYTADGTLIEELLTRDGNGTMIYRDSYLLIRRARVSDVPGILNLIQPLEDKGILVRRSRELLETEIHYFTVMEKDSTIVACAALHPMDSEETGELACVAVHPDYRNQGCAAKLLKHIERQAKRLGMERLFALTTHTTHWFIEHGFRQVDISELPQSRYDAYNYKRNSKVLIKPVNQERD